MMRRATRLQGAGCPAWVCVWLALLCAGFTVNASAQTVTVAVTDSLHEPLTQVAGDATRGRNVVANRSLSLCLLCHSGPLPEVQFQGDLAPSLAGAGARWTAAQLRLRLVDSRQLNPQTIMPPYHATHGLTRVAAAWRDQPILNAQQIEDVIAYLSTLR
jgi:L-cysteine S-thiosulfotransferase